MMGQGRNGSESNRSKDPRIRKGIERCTPVSRLVWGFLEIFAWVLGWALASGRCPPALPI